MNFTKLFFFCLLLLSVYNVKAQNVSFSDSLRLSYSYISSLKFSEAQKLFTLLSPKEQKSFWIPYEKNYMDFLKVFIGEDKALYGAKQNVISNRYNQINSLPQNNPYRLWMLANMNLQSALVKAKFGQNLQFAWAINKAYRQITKNVELFPDFIPNKLTLGVLQVMIGVVPDQYKWVLKIFSMNGSVEQGEKEIYEALDSSLQYPQYHFLKNEALFYLSFIMLNLNPSPDALDKLQNQLDKMDDSNLIMAYLKVEILIKTGKNDEALSILNKIINKKGYYPFYFLYYLKGDCLLKKLDFSADKDYVYFLKNYKGVNYVKDAWRKRAWIALLQGDTSGYHRMMDSVLVKGASINGRDQQALQEAEIGRVLNPVLLKTRLLFDGGYYEKSKEILTSIPDTTLTDDEKLEKIYRFARIAQNLKNWPEAKKEYRRTIAQGRYSQLYFAGNSALKLAGIYEVQDSLQQAEYYYQLCLELDFRQYRNGIRISAKEGLNRVQKALQN